MSDDFTSVFDERKSAEKLDLNPGRPDGMALIATFFGKSVILLADGKDYVVEAIIEQGGIPDIDDKKESGLCIATLKWENLGPSDWPGGGNEYGIEVSELRPATEEEWMAHAADEWPWEPYNHREIAGGADEAP